MKNMKFFSDLLARIHLQGFSTLDGEKRPVNPWVVADHVEAYEFLAQRHQLGDLNVRLGFVNGTVFIYELSITAAQSVLTSSILMRIIRALPSQDFKFQTSKKEKYLDLGHGVIRQPHTSVVPVGRHTLLEANRSGDPFPTLIIQVGMTQSLLSLHEKALDYLSDTTDIQLVISISVWPRRIDGTFQMVAMLYNRTYSSLIPQTIVSFGSAPLHSTTRDVVLSWDPSLVIQGYVDWDLHSPKCDQPLQSIFSLLLPSNIKIHVIDTVEECNRLIGQLYSDISRTLPVVPHVADDAQETPFMVTPDQCVVTPKRSDDDDGDNDMCVIGLDAEWSHQAPLEEGAPLCKSQKVALIQLATKDTAYVIQCIHMGEIPQSLVDLLTDPRILKAGVAIAQDAATIYKNFGIIVKGCVDLVPLAKVTHYEGNGLASLALNVLGHTIDKSHHIRCSHWENRQLTDEQIQYSACDAWIGRAIFAQTIAKWRSTLDAGQPQEPMDFSRPFINTTFKFKDKPVKTSSSSSPSTTTSTVQTRSSAAITVPDGRTLYDNCLMYGPDGVLLCNISKKKVKWYLDRDLATITLENPLTIVLKFQPKGNGHADDQYYLSNKENRCVVCGSEKRILRHSIVPHSYRQYLPVDIKSHSSHDVVILCCECHFAMNRRLHFMKMMIASQYGVPLDNNQTSVIVDKDLLRDKKKKFTIPDERLQEFKASVLKHFNKEELEESDVVQLMESNPKQRNEDYVSHEQRVMNKVLQDGRDGIKKFIKAWRKNFIDTVQPRFLNEHWSVDKS
eukprot:gene18140-21684_t